MQAMRPIAFIHVYEMEKEDKRKAGQAAPRATPRTEPHPSPVLPSTAMTGAVQGEALIALTAEAAWGIVAAPTGTTCGPGWAKHSSGAAVVRVDL